MFSMPEPCTLAGLSRSVALPSMIDFCSAGVGLVPLCVLPVGLDHVGAPPPAVIGAASLVPCVDSVW